MRRTGSDGEEQLTLAALRRLVSTRPRRWLVAATFAAGLLAAVALAATTPADDLTFAMLAESAQSLMSVTVPFVTILLARDIRSSPSAPGVGVAYVGAEQGQARQAMPTLLAAAMFGAAVGAFGVLACAVSLAVAPASDPWQYAATVAVGSVLVQIVAALIGTGLGLLVRSWAVAFAASIVLPLGLWLLLGAVDALRPAQPWLTPYASVRNLLSGEMSALAWAQWLVMTLLWPVCLNAAGIARVSRRHRLNTPRG